MADLQERLRRALGDRYALERELGRGGAAVVYLAEDLRHHRRVALKALRPEVAETLGAERFLQEIEIVARLSHPRIVPVLDSGEAGGLLFYVMPYVEGESLRERLQHEKQLPVEEAVDIVCQVAAALAFAHGKGVVHRDVKPGNVLLTAGEAVVTDFGVARALTVAGAGRLTESGVAVGTPAYMSPEQASADREVGPRSDVYGLGCLLYEMLAGEPPFTGATAHAVTARKLTEPPPDVTVVRDTVPAAVAGILRRALAPVAADRHATAGEFGEALRRARFHSAGGASDMAGPSGPVVSRRGLLLGAAATGLAGFAGGIFVPRGSSPPGPPQYHRLTFQRGMIRTARFGPDYQTILYGALWGGDVCRVYRVRPDSPQSHPMDLPPATPLAVSSHGQIALALGTHFRGVLTSGTLARVPWAGGAPREMLEYVRFADWTPDGSELAVVRRVEGQWRLEFPVGNVVAGPSAVGFSWPRVSPAGDRVAFFELTATVLTGRVATVDRSGTKTILSPPSPNIFGLAWHGEEVWFTAAEERPLYRNAIHAVRPDGSVRVVSRIPGNASLHDIAPDGRALIARTDDRGGMAFRAREEPRPRNLSWLDATGLEAISRDGSTVLFTEVGVGGGEENSVYVRATTGGPAVRLGRGRGLALSPDGRWALAADVTPGEANDHLKLLPIEAGEERRIERPGFSYHEARGRFLPDGERLLVSAMGEDGDFRFYVQDLDGPGFDAVTPAGLPLEGWELSPDGRMLALSSDRGLDLYPLDGGEPRAVPISDLEGALLAWIDDGLLLSEPTEDPYDNRVGIVQVDPLSGRRESWDELRPGDPTGLMVLPSRFEATPDGRAFAYSWHRAVSDLYLVEGLR